jgi:hypothetical protein
MRYYRFLLLLFASTLCFISRGQETGYAKGYIVTVAGDTLNGLVKNKNMTPYRVLIDIKFKRDEKSKVETFSPDRLKGFRIGTKQYVSKEVKVNFSVEKLFVEIIVDGHLSYYALEYTGFGAGNISTYVILEKINEKNQLVYDEHSVAINFKKKMAEYLKDAPGLVAKINDGTYTRKHVEAIVNEYNTLKSSL